MEILAVLITAFSSEGIRTDATAILIHQKACVRFKGARPLRHSFEMQKSSREASVPF